MIDTHLPIRCPKCGDWAYVIVRTEAGYRYQCRKCNHSFVLREQVAVGVRK